MDIVVRKHVTGSERSRRRAFIRAHNPKITPTNQYRSILVRDRGVADGRRLIQFEVGRAGRGTDHAEVLVELAAGQLDDGG